MLRIILFFLLFSTSLSAQHTIIQYLSGTGSDDTVDWEFYCTDGMNSKQWMTIPVPSCWELQGFGEYNYGHVPFEERLKEQGVYRHTFQVPQEWRRRNVINIVFEGVMTDAEVKINGKMAGPIHQGAFYQFKYNITELLNYGEENVLEVKVSKHSANESINIAERKADYWIFGGIFRPVYLEVLPENHIKRVAIDARANGDFAADVYLSSEWAGSKIVATITDLDGEEITGFETAIEGRDSVRVSGQLSDPELWSPEFPNLYVAEISLQNPAGEILHQVDTRIGFRTVEVRDKDGIYVNGVRVKLKGICRHTFHPESGRTSNKDLSILDVELCKEMNMNALRMSHYPPDQHLLDICDSLGLFVLDELAGWQYPPYDDTTGLKLLKEMIPRDVNHPSIIIWDNGNEGGWNPVYDHVFDELDIQKRIVIHPWQTFGSTNTIHYTNYNYLAHDGFSRDKILFPTEEIHGLYDGGHGAGLEDYWLRMWQDPLSAGAFLWVFSDEAVVRVDRNGELDADGNHAPDGIVGPYREKEGSFFTVKEIWSPVFIEDRYITPAFNGIFNIENRFHYTNLNQCRFEYTWLKQSEPGAEKRVLALINQGELPPPDLAPGQKGQLQVVMPDNWRSADVLYLKVSDPHGREIFTWSWPVKTPAELNEKIYADQQESKIMASEEGAFLDLAANGVRIRLSKGTGNLIEAKRGEQVIPLSDGPVLTYDDPPLTSFRHYEEDGKYIVTAKYRKDNKRLTWTFHPNGLLDLEVFYLPPRKSLYPGITFTFPEDQVAGMDWLGEGPYRVWKNRMKGGAFGVWQKDYNNTITGFGKPVYPEFKGYHANLYWADIKTKDQPGFKVFCHTDNIFLRMLTPEEREDKRTTAMSFPEGDISFLHGISAVGTKFKAAEELGPQSQPYSFNSRKFFKGGLEMKLTFDFR
jgi:hypothetical protein